jgi:flagellar motor switch protein FliN
MLEMELELADNTEKPDPEEEHLLAHVSFAGDVMGSVGIQVNDMFGRIIAAGMLDMNLEDAQDQDEIKDVIGEVTNIIAGNLKSAFCDSGLVCEISPPTITFGKNYSLEIPHMSKYERFVFRFGQFYIYVEVCVKINDSAAPEKQLEEVGNAIKQAEAEQTQETAQAPDASVAVEEAEIPNATEPAATTSPSPIPENAATPPVAEAASSPSSESQSQAVPADANGATAGSADTDQNLDVIMNIPLDIVVELGRAQLPIQEVLTLGPGSAIELNDLKSMPLNIMANKKIIARGHVVVEDEKYGIRISEIVSSRKRLANLG